MAGDYEAQAKVGEEAEEDGWTKISFDKMSSCNEKAAAIFNDSPQDFARKYGDASTIARVLYDCHPLLDVELLGEKFGSDPKKHSLWIDVLRDYACCFDFRRQQFVRALRDFLYRFRLPGESDQISRIMEAFAHSFFVQNSDDLSHSKGYEKDCLFLHRTHNEARGYYLKDIGGCCLHCGCLDTADTPLFKCEGCRSITFCRKCMRLSSSFGHAFVGRIGYGQACLATMYGNGILDVGKSMDYCADGKGLTRHKIVEHNDIKRAKKWVENARLPFLDEDAAFVFAFSVIILTTNLHNPNVKEKMTKQQFLVSNKGINGGRNLPGDYLAAVYDEIAAKKIEVMGLVGA